MKNFLLEIGQGYANIDKVKVHEDVTHRLPAHGTDYIEKINTAVALINSVIDDLQKKGEEEIQFLLGIDSSGNIHLDVLSDVEEWDEIYEGYDFIGWSDDEEEDEEDEED